MKYQMPAQRAIVVVQWKWLAMTGLSALLMEDPLAADDGSGLVRFVAVVLSTDHLHGLICRSSLADTTRLKLSKSEVMIPWKYVEGVAWTDDLVVEKGKTGFPEART
jgi:hypothetical protein